MFWWIAGLTFGGTPSKGERLEAVELAMEQLRRSVAGQAELQAQGDERTAQSLSSQETVLGGLTSEMDRLELRLEAAELQIARLTAALGTPSTKTGARLALLEAEVQRLAAAPPPPLPAPSPPDADVEAAAKALLDSATAQTGPLHQAETRLILDELATKYPDTRANRSATRLREELAVVGAHPGEPSVTRWFTEPPRISGEQLTLVVFWEAWCPHCQREVPKLSTWVDRYGERGLRVVALTKMTKGVTEERVLEFISTNGIRFPMGLEDGKYSEALDVAGIPAAALIRDGTVLWRGHPARLEDAWFEALLTTQ